MSDCHDLSLMSEIKRFVSSQIKETKRLVHKPEDPAKEEDERKDSASDVRNALLVVATLIAAVTFQAGVNPPGGVWQEKYPSPGEAPPPNTNEDPHDPGTAVLGYKAISFVFFLLSNTAAFSTSGIIIGILIQGFPFDYLVRLALLLMVCTYVASISAVLPNDLVNMVYLAFLLPFIYLIVRCLWHIRWSRICCRGNKK